MMGRDRIAPNVCVGMSAVGNDQYPRSPRQTIRITRTTSSSFDARNFTDRSSSSTAGSSFDYKFRGLPFTNPYARSRCRILTTLTVDLALLSEMYPGRRRVRSHLGTFELCRDPSFHGTTYRISARECRDDTSGSGGTPASDDNWPPSNPSCLRAGSSP